MTTTAYSRPLAEFEHHGDVGAVQVRGSARVEGERLVISGSGHNMWLDEDEFHFVWNTVDGDWSLSAAPQFQGAGVGAHRKAVILVRESLDTNAVYAGIAVHGDGLTSIQYRSTRGGLTDEVRFRAVAPARLSLRKVDDRIEAVAGDEGHSVQLALPDSYYFGLAVCSHVDDVLETVEFSDIELARVERHE